MDIQEFQNNIKPFFWVEHASSFSVCLSELEYKQEVFMTRETEGFLGNGYDWGSLATVFLTEKMPHLAEVIRFDPEAGMYTAYSSNKQALQDFSLAFKEACEDQALITDLFSRAELD